MNLLAIIPNMTDATSYYRGIGPLAYLKRQHHDLNVIVCPQKVDWSIMKMVDGVFLQRPFREMDAQIIEIAKLQQRPVWVDYDDDLLSVGEDNPTYPIYGPEKTKKTVLKCLEQADFISASTEFLRDKLSKLSAGKSVVIPNAFDDDALDIGSRKLKDEVRKCVMWRGSHTHQRDLMGVADDIIKASRSNPDWIFMFIGYNPWFITERLQEGRWIHVPAMDIMEYMKRLQEWQPRLMIVPLADSEFNRSKSCCAWIEGTWAGATVVAPSWPEWEKSGILHYRESLSILNHAMKSDQEELRRTGADESWAEIKKELTLTSVNMLRWEVCEGMMNG